MSVFAGRRLRNEVRRIDRAMRNSARQWGQTVVWYEFDPTSAENVESNDFSTDFDDDLYDEGGIQIGGGRTRKWKKGKRIPVYQAILNEGEEGYTDEGQYQVDRLSLIVNYTTLVAFGISNPTDRGAHVKDRLEYDGRLFRVTHFLPRGRVADVLLTVTVSANEVKADEEATDDPSWHA